MTCKKEKDEKAQQIETLNNDKMKLSIQVS